MLPKHVKPQLVQEVRSAINVTPLVDVCLVLLIIFMVVTPMLGRGAQVAPPATRHPRPLPETSPCSTWASFAGCERNGEWPPLSSIGRIPRTRRAAARDQVGSTTRSALHRMELVGTSGNAASGDVSWLTRQFWRRRRRAAQRARSEGQSW